MLAGVVLASCSSVASMGPRQLVAIAVQPGSGEAVAPDGTVPFSATGTFDQAPSTQSNMPVEWSSSDPGVATIDPTTGVATCVAVGGPISVTARAAGKGGMVQGAGSLACKAAPNPVVSFNPARMFFMCSFRGIGAPVCGCGAPKTTTLTNVGAAALGIDSIVSSNSQFSQTNTCGSSLEAGQSCSITVSFRPRMKVNVFGAVEVTDNAAGSPQSLALGSMVNCVP
jgi:Big-like domain-containing protein